jgi:hypothetical protein
MIYLEFTLKESLEHFLSCHCNAFQFFGGVPERVMVDNCKVAILKHPKYGEVVPHPRYAEMATHYNFQIKACALQKGNEKGRVERGIGYVKTNFLNGLEISSFTGLNDIAWNWRDTIANVRIHSTTKQRPFDLFTKEKPCLNSLPIHSYDCAIIKNLQSSSQFFVRYDSNRYSVPAEYASNKNLIGRIYPDCLCIYYQGKLIAHHPRSYQRNKPISNPNHERELLKQRRNAREQKILQNFLALSSKAEDYYTGLAEKKLNPRHHLRKIMALAEIYGKEDTARAIEDALEYHAFGSDYIANLLEQRQRILPTPSPLHLTRKQDLLQWQLQPPDLTIYNFNPNNPTHKENNDGPEKK